MIKSCIDALSKLREALTHRDYSMRRHDALLDFEIHLSKTWDEFRTLTSVEWTELRSFLDSTFATALLIYSMRMSMLAVRNRDEGLLHNAVMALTVDDHLVDDRDTQIIATLVYDAATRIGCDPEALFRAALRYTTAHRRRLLESFLGGPSYLKCITSMGYEAVETELGFVYKLRLDDLLGWPTTAGEVEDLISRLTSISDNSETLDK